MPGYWSVKMSKKSEQAVKKRESKNSKKRERSEPVSISLNSLINPPPRPLLKVVCRVKTSNVKICSVGGFRSPCLFHSAPTRSQVIDEIVVSPTPNSLTLSRRNLTITLICSVWFRQQHLGQSLLFWRIWSGTIDHFLIRNARIDDARSHSAMTS